MSKIPFFKTYISKHALNKVKSTIKSTFLNEGKIVKNFETEIGNFLNLKNINTTSSGTSAIHLALACLKLKKGDEVILTPQTFIASGLAILYVGASPIFCDIDLETGNISIESLKKNPILDCSNLVRSFLEPTPLDHLPQIQRQHAM